MNIASCSRQIEDWRHRAKQLHGYTDAELARKLGCSPSVLTHKKSFYKLPYYQAVRLKELADE